MAIEWKISIHALREEGDVTLAYMEVQPEAISIHALREEGDKCISVPKMSFYEFLSTPSARRATNGDGVVAVQDFLISIHALREEGDERRENPQRTRQDFYPRPPRGGRPEITPEEITTSVFLSTPSARRATGGQPDALAVQPISIHALREEGDRYTPSRRCLCDAFLSTPSARRATAKTETKSLFSNKLYNILHEFRRALIYNGSKNYPNHAK